MAQLSPTWIFKAIMGLFSSLDATDEDRLRKSLWRKQIQIDVTDGGTAATAQGEKVIYWNNTGFDVKVTVAKAFAPIAITAQATNFATFTVNKRDSAGGNSATVATLDLDTPTTDDMALRVAKDLPLTAANVVVPNLSTLYGQITKTGTGMAVASATAQAAIVVELEQVV